MVTQQELKNGVLQNHRVGMKYPWAEPLWQILYICILNKKCDTAKLIDALPNILPCDVCKTHLESYLKLNPLPSCRDDIFRWCSQLEKSISPQSYKDRYADVLISRGTKDAMPSTRNSRSTVFASSHVRHAVKTAKGKQKKHRKKNGPREKNKNRRMRRNRGGCSLCRK